MNFSVRFAFKFYIHIYGFHKIRMAEGDAIADVLIIGAGTIGCSIARELSKTSLNIIVLEKSYDVSQGASKSNSGVVHGGYDDKHGTLKAKLSHRSNQMFTRLNAELNFGFSRIGSLTLAYNDTELNILKNLMINGKLNGVSGLELLLSKEVIQSLEPNVSKSVIAALRCHWTGITSPYEFVIALAENASTNGVRFRLNEEVVDILRISDDKSINSNSINGQHYLIRTRGVSYRSRLVINAAGLLADKIAAMVGANNFSIIPRKGEYIILENSQGSLARHVLFPVPTSKGKGILVSPTFHGNMLLGPTSRDTKEEKSKREILTMIISSAKNIIPNIDPSKAITSYTGLRSKSDRGDFIIEESESAEGFINVAGIDSPGLTSSPAVAEMVCDLIQKSLKRMYGVIVSKSNFNPYRNPIIVKKGTEFDGKIDHQDPSKNIICRCERVTEAEIVDAIWRPLGAKDTDSMKRRTRAGMGSCQGIFNCNYRYFLRAASCDNYLQGNKNPPGIDQRTFRRIFYFAP